MKRFDEDELGAALHELRPTPTPEFATELDQRAAAGFPRPPRGSSPLARLRAWLRERKPRQLLLPAGGVALTAVAVTTAIVIAGESGGRGDLQESAATSTQAGGGGAVFDGSAAYAAPYKAAAPLLKSGATQSGASHASKAQESTPAVGPEESSSAAEAESGGGSVPMKERRTLPQVSVVGAANSNGSLRALASRHQRKVERSAEITIGTKPGEVGAASTKVFQAVHVYDGVVLNSSTRDGSGTSAEASFELLIPSARLGDAMAAFSRIGEVRSRHEATADITAPTVGAEEKLEDSRARTDSLLAQLREASDEGERELVEAELRAERRTSAQLKAQLDELGRRASLSHVSVRVESGRGALPPGASGDGKWGVGDAISSAGRVLAVAAGVIIIGAAILAPIALLLLLAWLAGRAWSRRARERALS